MTAIVPRAILATFLLLGALAQAPPVATAAPNCWAYDGQPCTFSCGLQDTVAVYVYNYKGGYMFGTASCGGASASCQPPAGQYYTCNAESANPSLPSDAGTCTFTTTTPQTDPNVYVGYASCYVIPYQASVGAEVPSTWTPEVGGGSVGTPPVDTPGVGSVRSPEVRVPATCQAGPCTTPTNTPPVRTPVIPEACVLPTSPQLLCVDRQEPVTLLDAQTVPPVCALAPAACLPPGERVLAEGAVSTPPVAPIHVLDARSVGVPYVAPREVPGAAAYVNRSSVTPGVPQVGTQEQHEFYPVEGVPVSLCRTPCPVPYAYGNGQVWISVVAGGETLVWREVSV